MTKRSKQSREAAKRSRIEKRHRYDVEIKRMDYEGGNQGKQPGRMNGDTPHGSKPKR